MFGWTIAITLLIASLKPDVATSEILIASGLFAIAGSIGFGLSRLSEKLGK